MRSSAAIGGGAVAIGDSVRGADTGGVLLDAQAASAKREVTMSARRPMGPERMIDNLIPLELR